MDNYRILCFPLSEGKMFCNDFLRNSFTLYLTIEPYLPSYFFLMKICFVNELVTFTKTRYSEIPPLMEQTC